MAAKLSACPTTVRPARNSVDIGAGSGHRVAL